MHVVLISDKKANPPMIHASENQRRTPCGIYYTRPENVKMYPTIGEMSDVMQITCEKCKTVIAKHLIRESNKEMAAQLKEEQRMLKRERANSKHHGSMEPPAPAQDSKSSGGYIPPSMRKSMSQAQAPIDTPPPPPPAPISIPAPNVSPSAPAATTAEDALSQFAIPVPNAPQPAVRSMPQPAAPAPANDVLSQFAIPGTAAVPTAPAVPVVPQPAAPAPANDVLAQFAIPGTAAVPTAPAAPAVPQPAAPAPANDVLAQFAIPGTAAVPTAPAAPVVPQPAAPAPANDVLAQFAIPGTAAVPTAPAAPVIPQPAPQDDLLAQFSMPKPGTGTVMDKPEDILAGFAGQAPSAAPVVPQPAAPLGAVEDSLNDLLLMPSGAGAPKLQQPSTPTFDTVPDVSEIPTVPTAPVMNAPVPSLNVPPVPPAPPVPQMPVPPTVQQPSAPFLNAMQNAAAHQPVHNSLFSAPSRKPVQNPNTPMPLFVGYSADGRQVFQTYDALGNPIPITEPVYSAPPEQPKYNPAAEASAMMNHAIQNNGPVMDMDELMKSMGIETPAERKKKLDSGKPINFTEYKMPEKKTKKRVPASAQSSPMPVLEDMGGPVSAAEAKRRKKVDKINKEFEKQLRSRGIDPITGGLILDNKK